MYKRYENNKEHITDLIIADPYSIKVKDEAIV